MKRAYLSRRDSIVISAIEIIDELGIHELSIRELAKREGVSEPALYRHFKNKQDIILGVLNYYSRFDFMIAKTIKGKGLKSKEGISFFIKSIAENYENDPGLTAIPLSYDMLRHDDILASKIKEILKLRYKILYSLIQKGQKEGEIKKEISKETLIDTILGILAVNSFRWRITGYDFSLKDRVCEEVKTFLEVC